MSRFLALFKNQRWPVNQVGSNLTTQIMLKHRTQDERIILTELGKECEDIKEGIVCTGVFSILLLPLPVAMMQNLLDVNPKVASAILLGGFTHQWWLYSRIGNLARNHYYERTNFDFIATDHTDVNKSKTKCKRVIESDK